MLPNDMGGVEERREAPSPGKAEDWGGAREEALKEDDTFPSGKRSSSLGCRFDGD